MGAKPAVIDVLATVSATLHVVPVPVQAPDQPVNVCVPSGTAVKTTGVLVKLALQVAPQLIPEGADVTLPPAPLVTIRVAVAVPARLAMPVPPGRVGAVEGDQGIGFARAWRDRDPTAHGDTVGVDQGAEDRAALAPDRQVTGAVGGQRDRIAP
jgi:hypothetical protein